MTLASYFFRTFSLYWIVWGTWYLVEFQPRIGIFLVCVKSPCLLSCLQAWHPQGKCNPQIVWKISNSNISISIINLLFLLGSSNNKLPIAMEERTFFFLLCDLSRLSIPVKFLLISGRECLFHITNVHIDPKTNFEGLQLCCWEGIPKNKREPLPLARTHYYTRWQAG